MHKSSLQMLFNVKHN